MNLYKDLLFELIFRFDPLIELEGALQTKTPISSLFKQHGSLPNAMWTLSGLVSTFKCIESQETGFPLWVDTRYATVYTPLNAFSKKKLQDQHRVLVAISSDWRTLTNLAKFIQILNSIMARDVVECGPDIHSRQAAWWFYVILSNNIIQA